MYILEMYLMLRAIVPDSPLLPKLLKDGIEELDKLTKAHEILMDKLDIEVTGKSFTMPIRYE